MAKDTKSKKPQKREERPLLRELPSADKDPYRWVVFILFLLVLFVSYIFWVQG
jgi:hypothetical protein